MPIGKSSLKRVANNGYSNVKTEAPDMENSVEVKEKPKSASAKKTASKKPTASVKRSSTKPAEKTEVKAPRQPKTSAKPATAPKAEEEKSYVNVGRDMPAYLL